MRGMSTSSNNGPQHTRFPELNNKLANTEPEDLHHDPSASKPEVNPTSECTDSAVYLPVRDTRARSPAVPMTDRARSHGNGSYRIDAHAPVAGGRDSTGVGPCSR